jgi:hypothetical protein
MVVQALYGLRSSRARWHDHLAATLRDAGFKACKADADVWMRPAVKADGAKVLKYRLEHSDNPDKVRWSLSAEDYVNRAVKDVETELEKVGKALLTKVTTPTTADYRPELDQSKELGQEQATYFAGLIGVLRWCIELGRIDIIVEVSLLSRFLACPREGHMQQAFHVFGYLKKHARSWMVFDETEPAIDQSRF